jgi:hypothetical protein
MKDLHDLLREASDGNPNRPADATELLQRARHRLNRRRGITVVSGLAVTALAVAGGVAWLPSNDHRGSEPEPPVATESTPVGPSEYNPAEVSNAEAGARCTTVLHNRLGSDDTWRVAFQQGRLVEGEDVMVVPIGPGESTEVPETPSGDDTRDLQFCRIPRADQVDSAGIPPTTLPADGDLDGLRAACSQIIGYDFSGWEVVASARSDLAVTAVLRSSNDHIAFCELYAVPGLEKESGGGIFATSDLEAWLPDYGVLIDRKYRYADNDGADDYLITSLDRLPGPGDAAQIVLVEPNGTEHVIPVGDGGWYALSEEMRLDISEERRREMNNGGPTPLRIKVLAADGTVIADYMDGDQDSTDRESMERG